MYSGCSRPVCPAAVVKVMSGKDSQCVRVLIPDEIVGYQGFHDVLLNDMADADVPYVAVSDLSALRYEWPVLVVSGITRHQLELEQMCHDCKKRYRGTQTGLCTFCEKVIKPDMTRHVTNYHLELAQLWHCPVSWCTQWKGVPRCTPLVPVRSADLVFSDRSSIAKLCRQGLHSGYTSVDVGRDAGVSVFSDFTGLSICVS